MYEFEEFVQILRSECVDFLNNIFFRNNVSLQEVAEETIKYCNATGLQRDGNVYLLVFPSGKRYCGQTVNLERRARLDNKLSCDPGILVCLYISMLVANYIK